MKKKDFVYLLCILDHNGGKPKMTDSKIESAIENRLRQQIERIGGKAFKFISDGNRGVPDRIVCLPGGKVVFVETKRPKGGVLSKLQQYRIDELRKLGFDARVVNTYELIDEFIAEVKSGL